MHAGCLGFKSYRSNKKLKGSSCFIYEDGEIQIPEKKEVASKKKKEKKEQIKIEKEETKRYYKINKSYIKKRMFAFFNLKATRRFCKFITVSYPEGTEDDTCHKLYNIFMTRIRKKYKFVDYVWVTERQQNGTLHFHMLVNRYLPIWEINNYMKIAINNLIEKNEIQYKNGDWLNYNGVDLSKKVGTTKAMAKYITKYVTKNTTTSTRLANYCSITVSRLFSSQIFTIEELEKLEYTDKIKINKNIFFSNEFIDYYLVEVKNLNFVFKELFKINEIIYNL